VYYTEIMVSNFRHWASSAVFFVVASSTYIYLLCSQEV
jgi:hypothetical protein